MSVEAVPAPAASAAVDPAAPPAPVVPPVVDPAAPPKPPEPPPVEKPTGEDPRTVAQRFAAMARKERQFVSQSAAAKQEIAAARAQLEAEKAEIQQIRENAKALEEARAKAKIDPDGYLRSIYGEKWYDVLTEYKLSGGKPTPDLVAQSVEEKLEAFKRDQEEQRKAEAAQREKATKAQREAIAAEQERTIAEFRENLTAEIKAKGDEFELVNLYGEHNLVFEVIDEHYAKHGRILSNLEAASLVEKHLEEEVAKAVASKKWQARAKPAVPPAPPVPPPAGEPSPTLSNGLSASPAYSGEPKNEQERIARAMAAMDAAMAKARG